MNAQPEYQPLLDTEQMKALAEALEESDDVAGFVMTAELVMRDATLITGALRGHYAVREDGDEFVFLKDGSEMGRVSRRKRRHGRIRRGR